MQEQTTARGLRAVCFTHPRGTRAPSAGGSRQETGRLVQLPVSCRRRHRGRRACGDMPERPAASRRHLSPSRIQSRCGDGVRQASGGPSSPYPGALAQRPRNEFARPFPPACPCSSLLLPRWRMLLPQPTPASSLRSRPPPRGHGQVHASLLSHRPAWPPPGLLPARDGLVLSGGQDGLGMVCQGHEQPQRLPVKRLLQGWRGEQRLGEKLGFPA